MLVCIAASTALPRVVVLTKSRLASLTRLIITIAASEPLASSIDLHVCCDVADRLHVDNISDVQQYLARLQWDRGAFTYDVAQSPQGLTTQWLNCSQPRSLDDRFVVVEDDVEIAPYALKWLDSAYDDYRNDSDTIGFSLHRQTSCFHNDCVHRLIELPWTIREYKYTLVSTWCFAPIARHWNQFRDWYWRQQLSNKPTDEMLLSTHWYRSFKAGRREHTTWELMLIVFCNKNQLYTIYYHHPLPLSLAVRASFRVSDTTTRERYHSNLVSYDVTPVDRSRQLKHVRLDGVIADGDPSLDDQVASIIAATKHLAVTNNVPLLTFVNYGFRNMTRHFFCNLRAVAPELIATLVIVVADAKAYDDILWLRSQNDPFVVLPLMISTAQQTLAFGTRAYFSMMLTRTELIARIAENGIPLFLFECDATVRENFVRSFVAFAAQRGVDFVGIQDNHQESTPHPNAGFLLMTNSTAVAATWRRIAVLFGREIAAVPLNDTKRIRSLTHDQALLRLLLNGDPPMASVYIVDRRRYLSGQALDDSKRVADVAAANVVLLNFAIGNEAKRQRAIKHNLWLFDDNNDQCDVDALQSLVLTVEKKNENQP